MLRAVLASLLLCMSCAVADLTEVVVIVEAEPGVRTQSTSLSVRVTTVPEPHQDPGVTLLENSNTPWHGDRYTIALSPKNPRVGSRYLVEASALVNGRPIATARLISGFVVGQTRYVRMLLEDQCLGVLSCAPTSTCHQGACVGAEIDPTQFSPSSALAPTSSSLPATTDEPADATVNLGPDAAQANGRDATATNDTDARPAIASDGSPDTHDPRAADASTAPTSDATTHADTKVAEQLPDAAEPQLDAGDPVAAERKLCRPGYYQGAFMGDYSYTLLSMKMDTKIQPTSLTSAPVLSLVLVGSQDAPSTLRVSAGCMSGTMMAQPSNRPFVARLSGTLDCETGRLTGGLVGVYYLLNNTDLDYPFTGAISAQFESVESSLQSGTWDAVEPADPNNYSSGMGQGSWTATWTSDSAPLVSVDPCAAVAAEP